MSNERLSEIKRIKTHIVNLDEKLNGGIPEDFIVSINGPAGSLKSSLAFNIMYMASMEGASTVYFSLEQLTSSLIQQMRGMNMDIEKVEDKMTLLDIGVLRRGISLLKETPLDRIDWSASILSQIRALKEMSDVKIAAIDSLNVLTTFTPPDQIRTKLFHFFRELKTLQVTVLIISESHDGFHGVPETEAIRYLSDGLINVSIEKKDRATTRLLQVAKLRSTDHPTDYYPLLFDKTRFKVLTQ